jgi:cell division GTPase FtsZ
MANYRPKVGIAFFGGCGLNILRLTVDKYDPKDYPDFFLFGGNTDINVIERLFGDRERLEQKRWGRALTLHQLGGAEVTHGRGAGAKPEVGKKAAETPESTEAIREFFAYCDELFIVTGLGGGTGTGATLVAVKIAIEMKKSIVVLAVLPDPIEGRDVRALAALSELQSLVPTIPIRNSYLKEMMDQMTGDESERVTYKDAWKMVNENSLVRMLLILREILQVTGDIINLDQADWETILSFGNYFFFGLFEVPEEKIRETKAEEIVSELFRGRFQDPGVVDFADVVGVWVHGAWPKKKVDHVLNLIHERVKTSRISLGKDPKFEIHMGMVHETGDERFWISFIAVAKEVSTTNVEASTKNKSGPTTVSHDRKQDEKPVRPALSVVRFQSDGERAEVRIEQDLANRFKKIDGSISATREEYEKIFAEIHKATGKMPDLPARFRPKPIKDERNESVGFIDRLFRTQKPVNFL